MAFASIPCRSSSDVDIKQPIRRYIEKNYGGEIASSITHALDQLQEMRKTALLRLRDKTASAAEKIALYHDSLLALEPRVPMSETEARVDWKWTDFYGKHKKVCTSVFERANLIYCYGCIHSQIAESANMKEADGLKQAVQSLKIAASVFDYLASNSYMFGTSHGDVATDTLKAYSVVMQAQVQECIFTRAEQTSLAPTLLSKLASRTRECFEDASKRCSLPSIKSFIPKDWFSIISNKLALYTILTHYFYSKVCEETRTGGERVARLTAAYELAKSASRSSSFSRPGFAEQIKRERDAAIKENDLIYHQNVPAAKDLPSVPSQKIADNLALPIPLLEGKAKDLFSALVPLGVLEAKNQAEVIFRSLLAAETHRLRESTSAVNAVMVSLNLPSAIQIDPTDGAYRGLLEKAAKIRQQGGVERLREQIYSLPDSAQRNRDILNEQLSTLGDEKGKDTELRTRFGASWNRQTSDKLNKQWIEDIHKMTNFLVQTETTDKSLAERFENQAYFFELLSKSDEELLTALKGDQGDSSASPTGNENARQELAQTCSRIESLKADRNSLNDQLDSLQLSESIINQLLNCYKSDGRVSEQHILDLLNVELEGPRSCVRASEEQQEQLLKDLQTKYEAYFGRSGTRDSSSLSTRLNAVVDDFFKLDGDVKEGMRFYAELTERCLKVQQKIDDFCLARNTEKTELLADITSNLGRVTVSEGPTPPSTTTSTVPPSRPPPSYLSQPTNSVPSSVPPPQPTASAPTVHAPATGDMPSHMPPPPFAAYGQPGAGWGQQPYNFGFPAYPPVGGMPMYGYYPGYSPMPPQMPPFPMMPGQPGPYGPGQPAAQPPRDQ